jgi:FKBP-type peptidyl-prolyl cis-trans isomerase 2
MKITIAFSKEKDPDFMSRQIMNRDKADFSHVLIIYDEKKIFHAVGEGVCVEGLDKFLETHEIPEKFEVELKVSRDYFIGFIEGSRGKEYSQSQIAAIATGKGEEINGDEKMICSELVGIVLTRMCGYELPGNQDSWRPIHCFNALKKGLQLETV